MNKFHLISKCLKSLLGFINLNLSTSKNLSKIEIQMMKSGELPNQSSSNEKLIMNSFQLFIHELQTKDISTKKTSIENVHIIALIMEQKEIIDNLLPFLVKLLVEQSSKDIKLAIVKSFKNVLPLLSKQKSYLAFVEVLIDIFLAFDQIDLKSEVIGTLNIILFDEDVLNFEAFKQSFKTLITQELTSISEPLNGKSAKQLTFYLTKYFFCHYQELKQEEISELITFLKKSFLFSSQNAYSDLKLLSENFHIFVQFWPEKFIKEMLFFINQFLNHNEVQEKVEEDKNLKDENAKPQILIPKQVFQQVKINMVQTLINLAKKVDQTVAFTYVQKLLKQEDSKVIISLIKKTKLIFETFDSKNLQHLLHIFRTFTQQPQDIKKAILQVLEEIPLEQYEKKEAIMKTCKNTIDLKNILVQSLIKNSKSQSVSEILNESDYDFKIKIFIKLPDSMLHQNVLYAEIVDSLLSEPKKNFRSKLNVILNLISRIQEKAKTDQHFSESFDISYLLPMLMKYYGDKIAIIRVNTAKLVALILQYFNVPFNSFKNKLSQCFYGENKSWLQRQTVLIMVKQYLSLKKEKIKTQKSLKTIQVANQEFHKFILNLLRDSSQGVFEKDKSIIISNLANLAQQIIRNFSIQI